MSDESHFEFEWCGLKLQWSPGGAVSEGVIREASFQSEDHSKWARAVVVPEGLRWSAWLTLNVEGHWMKCDLPGVGATPQAALEMAAEHIYTTVQMMWHHHMGKAPGARSDTCKDCGASARWQIDTPSPLDDRVYVRTRRCDECMKTYALARVQDDGLKVLDVRGWRTPGPMWIIDSTCERCSERARWRWDGPDRPKAFCDDHARAVMVDQLDVAGFYPASWKTIG